MVRIGRRVFFFAFICSTFVDVQLALRFDEAATYATPIDPLELMAKIVSMGRVTYLVLSCTPFSGDRCNPSPMHANVFAPIGAGCFRNFMTKHEEDIFWHPGHGPK